MVKKPGKRRSRRRAKPRQDPSTRAAEVEEKNAPRHAGRWPRLMLPVVAILCFAVWSQTISYPFHFDDRHAVRDNEAIRKIENLSQFLNPFRDLFARGVLNAGYTLNYAVARTDGMGYVLLHNSVLQPGFAPGSHRTGQPHDEPDY